VVVTWSLPPPLIENVFWFIYTQVGIMNSSTAAVVHRTHTVYDGIFEDLLSLITDADSFTSDVLVDTEWNAHFERVRALLKTANASLSQEKRRRNMLVDHLFIADEAEHWVVPDNYKLYLDLWASAMKAGYLPDCVCEKGPTPTEGWSIIVPSPKGKALNKVSFTGKALPLLLPLGTTSNVIPPSTPGTGNMVPSGGLSANPLEAAMALGKFLQGGTTGVNLPLSNDPGMLLKPRCVPLPPLLNVSNPWFAPVDQTIYEMDKFHQSYVPSDNKVIMNVDGTFSVKKGGKKIVVPEEWSAAAINLGHNMASSPQDHQFEWSDYLTWVHLVGLLFKNYTFGSVIDYERAWRKWRRSTDSMWSAQNGVLKDMFLIMKSSPVVSSGNFRQGISHVPKNSGSSPVCFDFSLNGCSRLGSCRFTHTCKRCNTTFPATSGKCPCIAGALPSGVTLPAGVTFGK
jgi:hypothetical protein